MEAYLDESHDAERKQTFAIAAFMGLEENWRKFELLWRSRTHGINAIFHMTECETNKQGFSPDKGWTPIACKQLITDLVTAIDECAVGGIGYSCSIEDFRIVFSDEPEVSMYLLCARHVIWKAAKCSPEPISFILDEQKKDWKKRAIELWDRVKELAADSEWGGKLSGIDFGSRATYTPLQAADFLAYECFKKSRNMNYHPGQAERKSIARLDGKVELKHYDRAALEVIRNDMQANGLKTLLEYLRIIFAN